MSSAASAWTSHASSAPPALAVAGVVPPAASTVVINASRLPRCASRSAEAPRSEVANVGTATPPAPSTASARASTYAVFPAECWAR